MLVIAVSNSFFSLSFSRCLSLLYRISSIITPIIVVMKDALPEIIKIMNLVVSMIFQQGDTYIYVGGEVPSLLFKKTLDES